MPIPPRPKGPLTYRARLLEFAVTANGRKTLNAIAASAGVISFTGYLAAHLWGIERVKETVQMYKRGFPAKPEPAMLERTVKIMDDVKMRATKRRFYFYFSVYGFDMFHMGSTKTRYGGHIGIPAHLSYETTDDVDKHNIMVKHQNVSWHTEDGQLLMNSLVLSDNAKNFAIAREMVRVDNHYIFFFAIIHSFPFLTYHALTYYGNNWSQGHLRPRSFRMFLYCCAGTFVYGLWSSAKDIMTKYYENAADKSAGSIDINYAKGGVEFYSKILQRNMALRGIMGKDGESQWTAYGNDTELIRQRHVPFSVRKENMEKLVEKFTLQHNVPESEYVLEQQAYDEIPA